MATIEQKLTEMLNPTVQALGFELVGIEYIRAGKHSTLRIYIDGPDGIGVEHCSEVSHQVGALLDVEDPINTEYTLEVSSPGIDRPLFTIAHYQQFVGEDVNMLLNMPVEGARKLRGVIDSVDGDFINVQFNQKLVSIAIDNIRKANIIGKI